MIPISSNWNTSYNSHNLNKPITKEAKYCKYRRKGQEVQHSKADFFCELQKKNSVANYIKSCFELTQSTSNLTALQFAQHCWMASFWLATNMNKWKALLPHHDAKNFCKEWATRINASRLSKTLYSHSEKRYNLSSQKAIIIKFVKRTAAIIYCERKIPAKFSFEESFYLCLFFLSGCWKL